MNNKPPTSAKIASLTPEEKTAINAFIQAARNLPKSICIEVDDDWEGKAGIIINKRTSPHSCQQVAGLRKKSLVF